MTLDELLNTLRMVGVDENTLRFAENCFELGREAGYDEAKAKFKDLIDDLKGKP